MRKLFITDIHGELAGLRLLLKLAEVDLGRDQLVIGGDMINRGKNSAGVLKELKMLSDRHPQHVHALIGNHEEMMGDYLRIGDKTWLSHGGRETLENLRQLFPREEERQAHTDWATALPLYYEDDQFVYTHAGLHPFEPLTQQSREILWMTEAEFYRIPAAELRKLSGEGQEAKKPPGEPSGFYAKLLIEATCRLRNGYLQRITHLSPVCVKQKV